MLEGAAPARSAGVRHRGFAKPRNPRWGGLAEGKTKVLAGWFAGEFCPALRSRRPFRFGDGVPARPCRVKRGMGILCAGVVGESNPACGPHAKKSSLPRPQKRAPPGLFRLKRRLVKEVHFLFFENCKNFRLCKNARPGLWGDEGSTNLHRGRKKNVLRT